MTRSCDRPRFTTNDMAPTINREESFRASIARGELVPIPEDYCPTFAGFYPYYPNRRNMAPKLRVLIDYLQQQR